MAALHRFTSNGKESSVWNATAVGVDVGRAKYIAECDEHGAFMPTTSIRDAIRLANGTHAFCDDCREDLHGKA